MDRFCASIRAGNYIETAAALNGLAKQTVYDWLRRGARGRGKAREREYTEFLDAVEKAQAEDEARDILLISTAAKEHWQAAAWKRERKNPAKWGLRIRVTVDEQQEAFLDRLERNLPPEVFDMVVEAGRVGDGSGEALGEDSSQEG